MNMKQILTGQTINHLIELDNSLVHKKITKDFLALQKAAAKAGFTLAIASSFRDFDRQLTIWNGKFAGQLPLLDDKCEPLDVSALSENKKIIAILRWSALPGASRHHWGTDLDIYAKNLLPENAKLQLTPNEYFFDHQLPFYSWLTKHLDNFGFFFPYAEDKGGVAIEPWHISHHSCADSYQKRLNIEVLQQTIQENSISGKKTIIGMLPDIYQRFITNISLPSTNKNALI